jgi:hypothetical protein
MRVSKIGKREEGREADIVGEVGNEWVTGLEIEGRGYGGIGEGGGRWKDDCWCWEGLEIRE